MCFFSLMEEHEEPSSCSHLHTLSSAIPQGELSGPLLANLSNKVPFVSNTSIYPFPIPGTSVVPPTPTLGQIIFALTKVTYSLHPIA